MKVIISTLAVGLVFVTTLAFAAKSTAATMPEATDPVLLGQYTLAKPDPKSDLKVASVIYNNANQLILNEDRLDTEYALTGPDKNGILYDGEDEPNCDGDESACYYDSRTLIKLAMIAKPDGSLIPQITISITSTNAFAEDGKVDESTTNYVLNWTNEIADAIPFYLNAKPSAAVAALMIDCETVVKPTVGHGGVGNTREVCGAVSAYKFRSTFAEAFPYFLKSAKGTKAITVDKFKEKLQDQVDAIRDFIANNSDKLYYRQSTTTAYVYSVDLKTSTITEFRLESVR